MTDAPAPQEKMITLDAPVFRLVDAGFDFTIKLKTDNDIALAQQCLNRIQSQIDSDE